MSHRKPYPTILIHTDRTLLLASIISLILIGTLWIISVWVEDIGGWCGKLAANLGVFIGFCLLLVGFDQVLGRFKGRFSQIVHSIIAFALFGCLFIITLAIWDATDVDVVMKTVFTMVIIAVISVLGWMLTLLLEWVNSRNQSGEVASGASIQPASGNPMSPPAPPAEDGQSSSDITT